MTDEQSLILLAIARINMLIDTLAEEAKEEIRASGEFARRSLGQRARYWKTLNNDGRIE